MKGEKIHRKEDLKARRVVNETQKRKKGTEMRRQISQLASNPG